MADLFESYERRLPQINAKLAEYGIASIEEAEKITKDAGLDVYHLIEGIQRRAAARLPMLLQQSVKASRHSAFPVPLLTDVR